MFNTGFSLFNTSFDFAHAAVFLLLPLPLLVWRFAPAFVPRRETVRLAFLSSMLKAVGQNGKQQDSHSGMPLRHRLLTVVCWVLLVVAAAGPREVLPPDVRETAARDLVLVLDVSGSMDTRDFVSPDGQRQSRMEAAREVITGFIEQRSDDRLGLVVFGTGAFPLAPVSQDHQALMSIVSQLEPAIAGEQTALGDALGVAVRMYDNSDAKERVAIVLTDGSDTSSSLPPDVAANLARDKGVMVHTIAMGDVDATDEEHQVDTALLEQVASTTGGEAFLGSDREQLAGIYQQIDSMTPRLVEQQSWSRYRPLFMWPMLAMLLLLSVVVCFETLLEAMAQLLKQPWRSGDQERG